MPRRNFTSERKFSTITSAFSASFIKIALPSGFFRLSARLRLLRCRFWKSKPSRREPVMSLAGLPGGSTLTTLAPQSASWRTAVGPARACVRSSTVKRDSGRVPMLTSRRPFFMRCAQQDATLWPHFPRSRRAPSRMRRLLLAQKRENLLCENLRLLDLGMVTRALDQRKPGAGDQPGIGAAVVGGHDAVAVAPQNQRRRADRAEPVL